MFNTDLLPTLPALSHFYYQMSFEKAVNYLRDTGKIKTNMDIARKTKQSKSYVSHILNGEKTLTPTFIKKFERAFDLSLTNPATYSVNDWKDILTKANFPDVSAKGFLTAFEWWQEVLSKKELIIEAQRKLIDALQADNEQLSRVIDKYKIVMLERRLKGVPEEFERY
jgi:hypothetical protein